MSTKLLLIVLALAPTLLNAAETIVFDGVHVVPMDRETVLEGMTVVVEDGLITSLGKRGRVLVPVDAKRIDADGSYLLPGLVEMHVHLRKREAVGLYLAHGFTTVRDMNGRLGDTLDWRDAVAAGELAGPRIVAASVTLYAGAPEDHPYPVETPEQARRAVRDAVASGYDLVKVYRLERDPFLALMDEAQKLSIPVCFSWRTTHWRASRRCGALSGSWWEADSTIEPSCSLSSSPPAPERPPRSKSIPPGLPAIVDASGRACHGCLNFRSSDRRIARTMVSIRPDGDALARQVSGVLGRDRRNARGRVLSLHRHALGGERLFHSRAPLPGR